MILPVNGLANSIHDFARTASQGVRTATELAASGSEQVRAVEDVDQQEAPETQLHDQEEISTGDMARDAVDLMASRQAVEANVAMVKAYDRVVGTLLDVMA